MIPVDALPHVIEQLDSDPASPIAEQVWVLKSAGPTYELKYRTKEGTTIKIALS